MNVTNKLFSLLGFAEPKTLKRFNDTQSLSKNILLLSINTSVNEVIKQAVTPLTNNIATSCDKSNEIRFEVLVVDATQYSDETSYQNLFTKVQNTLKHLASNARIVFISNTTSPSQSVAENTFTQAIIGFAKSLAKEVGRKGSTANVLLIASDDSENPDINAALLANPLQFFTSAPSAFVSGQVITLNKQPTLAISAIEKQRVAVITGAAQGIGAAIAKTLAEKGYFIVGVDIEPMRSQLMSTMKKYKGEPVILDVSAKTAGEELIAIASRYNGIDLMVHNAGITRDKTLAKMPEHFWQQTIAINLLSVMAINNALIANNAINKGARIVCLSSMNGIAGQGGQTNYACSKAGIIGYVESMSDKLVEHNININAVAPGFIETSMTDSIPFFTREMGRRMNALGQGGLPEDVAEAIAFLGSEENISVTGQTIRVCGLNIIGA